MPSDAIIPEAATFNFGGLITARIGLGTFEAGFGPVATLYLSMCASPQNYLHTDVQTPAFFYTKNEVGLRMAYWFSFAAVAGAFGGLIAFGIQQVHASIANWRLLFIIEVRLNDMTSNTLVILMGLCVGNAHDPFRCRMFLPPS